MILWLTGNTGAGKTTYANALKTDRPKIILDGDEMRDSINRDLTLSMADRYENNLRIARLATVLENQGYDIVIAVICPTNELRRKVKAITNCEMIYLPYDNDDQISDSPFEKPALYLASTVTLNHK